MKLLTMQPLNITIPQPCHENWDAMQPTEQGKFCLSCAKEVTDFSAMTDAQIFDFFENHNNKNTCGRFSNTQLNRDIKTEPAPQPIVRKLPTFPYFQKAIAALLILLPFADALAKPRRNRHRKHSTTLSVYRKEEVEIMTLGFANTSLPQEPIYVAPKEDTIIYDAQINQGGGAVMPIKTTKPDSQRKKTPPKQHARPIQPKRRTKIFKLS